MSSRQHFRVNAGEDRTLSLTARNGGAILDLTSYSIAWSLSPIKGGAPVVQKTGTTVSASAGTFTISLTDADTGLLKAGTYFHQALATSGGTTLNVCEGNIKIDAENTAVLQSSAGAVFNANQFYGSRAEAILTKIGPSAQFIETFGYYSLGDGGGGKYRRVGASPGAPYEYFQSLDGAYWQLIIETVLNVRQFGARADGTDDATAINKVFAFVRLQMSVSPYYNSVGYTVWFPDGNYHVYSSINATGFYDFLNWTIRGPGKIVGHCTGKVVLDLTDSRWVHVQDLAIYGDASNKPSIGILLARGSFGYCDITAWTNVTIDGSFSLACFFNYASEDSHFAKCQFYNSDTSLTSYALVCDGDNSLGATSEYKTLTTGGQSFNNNTFITCEFRKASGGPAMFLRRTDSHRYFNCYALSSNSACCVVSTGSGNVTTGLHLDIHCESTGATCAVRFDGLATQIIYGFYFQDHAPQTNGAIFQTGSGVTSVTLREIEIRIPVFGGAPSNNVFNTAGAFTVHGGRLYIGDNTYNNVASIAAFTGINETDTIGNIVARTAFKVGANQVVGARDTGWAAMTGTPNEAATYDTSSVTLPQLAGRVAALQAALTTHGLIGT